MKSVGILCALAEEAVSIEADIRNGEIDGHPVTLALSGMGKVNAAMTAQKLISEKQVRALIFTGVAGGINPLFQVGDLILASHTFQHDYGFQGNGFTPHPVGYLPELGFGDGSQKLITPLEAHFPDFSSLVAHLQDEQEHLQSIEVDGKKSTPTVHRGVVATGDQFIAQAEKKKWLRGLGADAVEMEGAAVVQVALYHQIPILLVRTISDQADHQSHFDFKNFISAVSVNHALVVRRALAHL